MTRLFDRQVPSLARLSSVLVLAASAGLTVAVPPPNQLTYQGELINGGAPANGLFTVRFGLFNASAGGAEIASVTNLLVNVVNGRFTTTIGPTLIDGPGAGTYTSLADVVRDFGSAHVEITVNGVLLGARQPLTSAPYALNAGRANSLDNVSVVGGSTWAVSGLSAELAFTGSSLRVQIGDSAADALVLFSSMYMLPTGAADQSQFMFFTNGGLQTGESFLWNDPQDRFELSDDLAITGTLSVGTTVASDVYNRVGGLAPRTGSMNSASDLLVSADLETLGSLAVGGSVLLRPGLADGDATLFFRESASDTGKSFRWDDSEDRFVFSDDIRLGEFANFELTTVTSGLTVDNIAEIRSTGGISIRVDTDNDEAGISAGAFVITCNNTVPLLRLQGTDEANLELDNGVVSDAFDFAEAFRAVTSQTIEPGDVVVHAVGRGLSEHCELADAPGARLLLGVVSTNPAYTAGMSFEEADRVDPALTSQRDAARATGNFAEVMRLEALMAETVKKVWKPIAQIGRVPTKVDGSFGPIKAGDYLTSSPTPGHAMKLTGPGMALGVALEDFDGAGKGKIVVFVRPSWNGDPSGELAQVRADNADLKARLDRLEQVLSRDVAKR